jgi:hypothetical protein
MRSGLKQGTVFPETQDPDAIPEAQIHWLRKKEEEEYEFL